MERTMIDEDVRHRSKKDTKNWCKGKVGIKHEFELTEASRFAKWIIKTWVCQKCGRKRVDVIDD